MPFRNLMVSSQRFRFVGVGSVVGVDREWSAVEDGACAADDTDCGRIMGHVYSQLSLISTSHVPKLFNELTCECLMKWVDFEIRLAELFIFHFLWKSRSLGSVEGRNCS